jgi:hypothetical protein
MLMLPDASGIAAYQLNQFPSAKAAEFFLDSSLRGHAPEGSVMFWALTWQPASDAATEPLVLIRDNDNPVVYPFSFSDIQSAFEFVQHEMTRGLRLSQVMIYWAVPAHVEVDFWGRSTILPPEPPASLTLVTPRSAKNRARPADAADAAKEDTRYLADTDIADAVRQADQAASKSPQPDAPEADGRVVPMPVPGPSSRKSKKRATPAGEPIDFPSASQKMQEARHARAAVIGWGNFALAVDEALDVYVARQVATKLTWNRLTRALGQAIEAHLAAERKALEDAEAARLEAARAADARQEAIRAEEVRQEAIRAEEVRQEAIRAEEARQEAIRAEEARQEAIRAEEARQEAIRAEEARQEAIREEEARQEAIRAEETRQEAIRAEETRQEAIHAEEARQEAIRAEEARQEAIRAAAATSRVMRKAWLNAAWTLEEAAYAYALEQRSRAIRAWRFAALGITEAVEAKVEYEEALQLAWFNAGRAIGEAHRTYLSQLRMFEEAWSEGATQIRAAVLVRQRLLRVRTGLNNFSIAIEEAIEAQAYRQEMIEAWDIMIEALLSAADAKECCDRAIAAWNNVAVAMEGVCRANVKKQKKAIRAWGRIAKAVKLALKAKLDQDAAIEAWTNISAALAEASYTQYKRDGLVAAWASASTVIAEAVAAAMEYEAAVTAWTNASLALEEAVIASARHEYFLKAWEAAGFAIGDAVEAFIAWKAGLEAAWNLLAIALDEAAHAMIARQAAIAAWDNAMQATGEMVHAFLIHRALTRFWRNAGHALAEAVPMYLFKQRSIAGWIAASIAIKQALVADAKLRIMQANLNKAQMAEVEKAVKNTVTRSKATKTTKAGKNGHSKKAAAAEAEIEVTFAPPPMLAGDAKLPEEFLPEEVVVEVEEKVVVETTLLEAQFAEALLAAVDAHDLDAEEPTTDDEDEESSEDAVHSPLFPSLWRSHEASRWKPREEPFEGFESPPGRF